MATTVDGRSPPKSRPGPKPRGRTVVPLTITVTHAQRAALEARADTEKNSISTIVRRFVAAGLAASGLCIFSTLIEITVARHARAISIASVGPEPMTVSTKASTLAP